LTSSDPDGSGGARRGPLLIALVAALVAADGVGLALSARRAAAPARDDWSEATRGVGLGGATSPVWSLFNVDARLEASCEAELFPIPGLACPDPTHGAGVATLPPRK
jgi:hypothetical protein